MMKFKLYVAEADDDSDNIFVPLEYEDENGVMTGIDALKQLATFMGAMDGELDLVPMPTELWPVKSNTINGGD